MKSSSFVSAVLACCLASSLSAEGSNPAASHESKNYSKTELKHMRQEAHTPEEYHNLAVYFEHRKKSLQEQADQEKKEWERRSRNVVGPAAKYPRPVDSARNLYEYYAYEADQAGVLQTRYEHLAGSRNVATSASDSSR